MKKFSMWNKSKEDKHCMISLKCGILKKQNKTKLVNITKKRLTDIENKLVVTSQEEEKERGNMG